MLLKWSQVQLWEMRFTSPIKQSFKRIRITGPKEESKSHQLMEKRKILRHKARSESDAKTVSDLEDEIHSVENELSSLLADENVNKIKDNLTLLSETDGSTAISGVWKLKNKLFPKNT